MTDEAIPLLPCPFCGRGTSFEFTINPGEYAIRCTSRSCRSSTGIWATEAEAIAAWNLRSHSTEAWQPIETAPKDGVMILLFAEGWGTAVVSFWHKGPDRHGWAMPVKANSYMALGPGALPTHWRPLPPPPVAEKDAE